MIAKLVLLSAFAVSALADVSIDPGVNVNAAGIDLAAGAPVDVGTPSLPVKRDNVASGLTDDVLQLIQEAQSGLAPILTQVVQLVTNIAETAISDVETQVPELLNTVVSDVQDLVNKVVAALPTASVNVDASASLNLKHRRHHDKLVVRSASNQQVANAVAQILNNIISSLNTVEDLTEGLNLPLVSSALTTVYSTIDPLLGSLLQTLYSTLTGLVAPLNAALAPILGSLNLSSLPIVGGVLSGLLGSL